MPTHTVVSHAGVGDASRLPRSAHLALTVGPVHALRRVVARGPGGRPARTAGHPPIAEGVGFEPTVSCPTHAFQACRFGRSRIPPGPPPDARSRGRRSRGWYRRGPWYPAKADRARRGARGALYPKSTLWGAEFPFEARAAVGKCDSPKV